METDRHCLTCIHYTVCYKRVELERVASLFAAYPENYAMIAELPKKCVQFIHYTKVDALMSNGIDLENKL